jgi:hypothetical protein
MSANDGQLSDAMIEAGLDILRRFNPERDLDEDYVVRIWQAMIAAKEEDSHD